MKRIAVIGGGFSGVSSAYYLNKSKFQVDLYESNAQLGGRASSFYDERFNCFFDNGQHLLVQAYSETIHLLSEIGVLSQLKFFKHLDLNWFVENKLSKLRSNRFLPAPLHLIFSFFRHIHFLSLRQKIQFSLFLIKLKYKHFKVSDRFFDYLALCQLDNHIMDSFLKSFLISIFNDDIKNLPSYQVQKIFNELFWSTNKNIIQVLYHGTLSDLFKPLLKPIQPNLNIFTKRRVQQIFEDENGYSFNDTNYDIIISSVPVNTLSKLMNKDYFSAYYTNRIATIYFSCNRRLFNNEMLGFMNEAVDWVFYKNSENDNFIYAGVKSHIETANISLFIKNFKDFMIKYYMEIDFKILRTVIEKRATFHPKLKTDIQPLRYGHLNKNLYICGDWTYPDYPCTIEAAVRSGKYCAELINQLEF